MFYYSIQPIKCKTGALTALQSFFIKCSGGWFNKKMSSYKYRKSHCGDKTILRSSYLHNGTSYTGKMTSLYWIRALVFPDVLVWDSQVVKCVPWSIIVASGICNKRPNWLRQMGPPNQPDICLGPPFPEGMRRKTHEEYGQILIRVYHQAMPNQNW